MSRYLDVLRLEMKSVTNLKKEIKEAKLQLLEEIKETELGKWLTSKGGTLEYTTDFLEEVSSDSYYWSLINNGLNIYVDYGEDLAKINVIVTEEESEYEIYDETFISEKDALEFLKNLKVKLYEGTCTITFKATGHSKEIVQEQLSCLVEDSAMNGGCYVDMKDIKFRIIREE